MTSPRLYRYPPARCDERISLSISCLASERPINHKHQAQLKSAKINAGNHREKDFMRINFKRLNDDNEHIVDCRIIKDIARHARTRAHYDVLNAACGEKCEIVCYPVSILKLIFKKVHYVRNKRANGSPYAASLSIDVSIFIINAWLAPLHDCQRWLHTISKFREQSWIAASARCSAASCAGRSSAAMRQRHQHARE